MRAFATFVIGVALGPASWIAATFISGKFEPFDSGSGFFVCQSVLVVAMLLVGARTGTWRALSGIPGIWAGMNAYAYLAGGSETRAWIGVLLISSLTLLLLPTAAAIIGGTVRARRRWRAGIERVDGR